MGPGSRAPEILKGKKQHSRNGKDRHRRNDGDEDRKREHRYQQHQRQRPALSIEPAVGPSRRQGNGRVTGKGGDGLTEENGAADEEDEEEDIEM